MNTWTQDLPTEPGWYAWRNNGTHWYPVLIVASDGDLYMDSESGLFPLRADGAWWCKIELPALPGEEE